MKKNLSVRSQRIFATVSVAAICLCSAAFAASVPSGEVMQMAQGGSFITLDPPAAATSEPAPASDPVPDLPTISPYLWSATQDQSGVTMMGHVPAQSLKQLLRDQAGEDAVDNSTLADGAPPDFAADAAAGLLALLALQEGEVSFNGARWSLTGRAASAADNEAILTELSASTDLANWTVDIAQADTSPPAEADPPPIAQAESSSEPTALSGSADSTLPACAEPVAALSNRNAILFQSGAAIIATQSEPTLDVLALDLASCPDAVIHVEGHTDADGDERRNMALSVARAEAVVAALVTRGVAPERLYAIGYGETTPIAPNDTPEGKRLNRRIVVAVQPEQI